MGEPVTEPEGPALAELLFESLGALRRQVRRLAGRPWPAAALSGAQIELVRLVRREPGIGVGRAADSLGLAANTVSTLVGQLTAAGVLRREPDPDDRRVARLHVTTAARRRIEGWRDQRADVVSRALARLEGEDRGAIERALPALGRLAALLGELPADGAGQR